MSLYLCLDQGGHASRALILDGDGNVVARALREVATQYPAKDRVEHDPEQIVTSLFEAAHEAMAALGARADEVTAAGLATQRSSIVCWDRDSGAALSPVISWQDRRAHAWLAEFTSNARDVEQRTGLRLSPHYGVSKLRWCMDHLDAVRTARRPAFGPLASFLAFRLLRQRPLLADPSNAQRTLLWALTERNWDPWLLGLFGIPRAMLPACCPTHHAFGSLQIQDRDVPLTILTGDQAAALFAFGAPRAGTAYVNLGTGAFVQRAVDGPVRVDGLLTGVAHQDGAAVICTLEGTVNGAGSALVWARQTLDLPTLDAQLPEWLARDDEPPLFLNGVGGLGAPYWAADFPSRFIGVGEPWQQAVAVAESIVFLIATNVEYMQRCGALGSLVLSGGLAQLDGLCQRLADLTGLPAWRPDEYEATARGLAWLLAGRSADWSQMQGLGFAPTQNPQLQRRYRSWREAMTQALTLSLK